MYTLYPYLTNDGSVGLFSPSDDDIYHSVYGAATEAYEKFIFPSELEEYFEKKSSANVLDICFGIGYNSKSFLNFILQNKKIQKNILKNKKFFSKNSFSVNKTLSPYTDEIYDDNIRVTKECFSKRYTEEIHTDNTQVLDIYNAEIDVDNNFGEISKSDDENSCMEIGIEKNTPENNCINKNNPKIFIKAIDTDRVLAYLAPFVISSGKKPPKNYKLPFDNLKIAKMLSKPDNDKISNKFKLWLKIFSTGSANLASLVKYPEPLNIFLLNSIMTQYPDITSDKDIKTILSNRDYRAYFSAKILDYAKFYPNKGYSYTPRRSFFSFLHNIYYNHISNRYKKALESPLFKEVAFELKISDARKELLLDKNKYDFIFLDAFTASKCPCLWTVDFFKLLFEHLEEDGRILTYSNSASVRNAFINAGFSVGKIYNQSAGKFMGTIAAKNSELIKHELSEYDLGLLKTKAGIFYRDENLTALNEEIIASHKLEVEKSPLISSSKFIKNFKDNQTGIS